MISREATQVTQTQESDAPVPADQVVEAAHLVGSTLLTGSIAAILTIIAVPVSIGLGMAWGGRTVIKRLRRDGK